MKLQYGTISHIFFQFYKGEKGQIGFRGEGVKVRNITACSCHGSGG